MAPINLQRTRWWAIISFSPLSRLFRPALFLLALLSIRGPTAALCFRAAHGSLSAHMLAFGQAAIGRGSFAAVASTCVTAGALISASDASRALLLIRRHGVTSPLSSVSLSHSLSFSRFVTRCKWDWSRQVEEEKKRKNHRIKVI